MRDESGCGHIEGLATVWGHPTEGMSPVVSPCEGMVPVVVPTEGLEMLWGDLTEGMSLVVLPLRGWGRFGVTPLRG